MTAALSGERYSSDKTEVAREHNGAMPVVPHGLVWMPQVRETIRSFPEEVRSEVGFALRAAQNGGKHPDAQPLRGFKGASVIEIRSSHDTNTYRVAYALGVPDPDTICVLHAFMKKSTRGIATPIREIELIRSRLATAKGMSRHQFA